MKEFIEKLIVRLEEESKESEKQYQKFLDDNECGRAEGFEIAIEIVNQLAEEYNTKDCSKCSRRSWYQIGYADAEKNNGWIPCEKELPKIPNSYLVTKMCENDGNRIYDTAHEIFCTSDGKWDCERDEDCEWKVIAWRKKIAPYQKGE